MRRCVSRANEIHILKTGEKVEFLTSWFNNILYIKTKEMWFFYLEREYVITVILSETLITLLFNLLKTEICPGSCCPEGKITQGWQMCGFHTSKHIPSHTSGSWGGNAGRRLSVWSKGLRGGWRKEKNFMRSQPALMATPAELASSFSTASLEAPVTYLF